MPRSSKRTHYAQQECPRHLPHINFEHYANPMVHPITGKTISSYKKLMHDPATAEVWQTAFGKDFGGMAQGDNKTGQKGTNAMFIMTHNEIAHAYQAKKFLHLPILLSTTGPKRRILIAFILRQWEIRLRMMATSACAQQTLTQQSCIGIAS